MICEGGHRGECSSTVLQAGSDKAVDKDGGSVGSQGGAEAIDVS